MLSTILALAPLLFSQALTHPVDERSSSTAGQFTFYPVPNPLSGICDLAAGPDGALWGEDILENFIVRLDPATGHIDQYPIPFTTPFSNISIPGLNNELLQDRLAFSCAIRPGADGNMYAGNGIRNQLVRINTTTKKIDVLGPPDPLGNLFPFNDIYTSEDGIWITQTTGNTFMFFCFATETFTTYNVPTPLALPLGLFVASDKKVYICELLGNKILIFDPSTKDLVEVPLPGLLQGPAVVRAEHDGYVYFSLFTGNGIGRINMKTHAIDLYHTDQLLGLGSVTTGPDSRGGVWMSFFTADVMARLDTATGNFSYVPFPNTLADFRLSGILGDVPPVIDISVNYGPGDNIWFGSVLYNVIGKYSLS